ncbi:MAG: cytosine/purine uracil thiamine allantoin permease [Hyphomonadaceae bacterium]|nr:MAG: cytosine/purine uracil thiamine allantoin permease [Hyphomonadaceae bacterium]KAF0183563.1 MAG: cytosine/purine uracil thiamine allantoin permease [Hyphomonadaceae bacterium]
MNEPNNQALDKPFMWHHHVSLWFSLGVGLLVIQMGSFLSPALGSRDAMLVIVMGSVIGSGILAYVARLGQQTGLNSAQLMQSTFGTTFAKLPILLNIFQLLGWTAFELVIMSEGSMSVVNAASQLGFDGIFWRAVFVFGWCILLYLLVKGTMVTMVRKFASKIMLPLVIVSLIWLTYQFLGKLDGGISAFLDKPGKGDMPMMSAMDLVLAMPISWLPLVCDYSRHGRSPRSTLSGTWLGYAFANIWCYGLGFLIVNAAPTDIGLVATILLAQGGLIALGLIIIDELDNAYGDTYSGATSSEQLHEKISFETAAVGIIIVAGFAAVFLPMHDLEKFLIMISSIFLPLFGVILGRFAKSGTIESTTNAKFVWPLVLIWFFGIGLFHFITLKAPHIGATLPVFAIMFLLAFVVHKREIA